MGGHENRLMNLPFLERHSCNWRGFNLNERVCSTIYSTLTL